ncbi:MAG: lysophospholipid acyltransferase family protein [Nostochopsis sp.]
MRLLFFLFIVRLVVLIIIGLRIANKERLPKSGSAIIVANHNSHLDTLVLITLFPIRLLDKLHPVAAEDYFLSSRFLAWFSLNIMGIIPLKRKKNYGREDIFKGCSQALKTGDILIIYPEGTRGEPEALSSFKSGIAHLAKRHPDIPIYPIFLHGLGKALPRGEALLVPFFCEVFIGEPIYWTGEKKGFMKLLTQSMKDLAAQGYFSIWE